MTKIFHRRETLILLSSFSLCLVLELIIGHRNNGEDQVDEVERTKENVEDKESDVERAGCLERDLKTNNNNHLLAHTDQSDLVQVLPEVLSHQPEGAEESVREVVKTRVAERGQLILNSMLTCQFFSTHS